LFVRLVLSILVAARAAHSCCSSIQNDLILRRPRPITLWLDDFRLWLNPDLQTSKLLRPLFPR
jgi:hypothetical protein